MRLYELETQTYKSGEIHPCDVSTTRALDPRKIEPVNDVVDRKKYTTLINSMKDHGWQGRPVLAMNGANGWQALTGSHRIYSARAADIELPIHEVDDDVMYHTDEDGNTISDFIGRGEDDKLADFLYHAGDHESAMLARYEHEAQQF